MPEHSLDLEVDLNESQTAYCLKVNGVSFDQLELYEAASDEDSADEIPNEKSPINHKAVAKKLAEMKADLFAVNGCEILTPEQTFLWSSPAMR